MIKENETFIAQYNKNKQDCQKAISALTQKMNKCKSKISALNEELKELNKKDISTEAAVNNINDILRNYGFKNFQIVSAKDENTYTLKRQNGNLIKDDLSEGEVTFITFLYYMQLVHGSLSNEGVENEKVLVIDDPISSLDSNVLFIVSSLIKEELKNLARTITK